MDRTAIRWFAPLAIAALAATACGDGGEFDTAAVHQELTAGMAFHYGNLHAHTRYSDGSGTPAEGFSWARDTAGLDFYTITDHAELVSSSEWTDLGNQANAFNADGAFVAMRGFEYTNYFSGHINVYDTTGYRSFWQSMTLSSFYTWLDGSGGIGQYNHPGDPSDFSKFSFSSKVADNMGLLEVGNGGSTIAGGEYLGHFHNALSKGWKVAPTSNLDNHSLSDSGRRTVIVAPALTRANLVSAIRARRAYATDDPNIEVAFLLNGSWMGSTVTGSAGTYVFDVSVVDDEVIAQLDLVVKGTVAATLQPNDSQVSWAPSLAVTADTYAYLRVTGADGQVALTAPIWIDVP